jgi:septal ring factor EnvC (AmiA/AmiB activator)
MKDDESVEEEQLYQNLIRSQYAFYSKMKPKWVKQMLKETEGLILKPEYSKPYVEKKKKLTKEQKRELGQLYRNLSLIYHPDKSDDPDSNQVFARLLQLYETNDLENMKLFPNKSQTLDEIGQMKKELEKWSSELWFVWHEANECARYMFWTEKELTKANEKLREESERLKKQLEELKDANKELKDKKEGLLNTINELS